VSVSQICALARRRILAVAFVLLITVGIGIYFRQTRPLYIENAMVAIEPIGASGSPFSNNSEDVSIYDARNDSLIITCQLIAMQISDRQGAGQLAHLRVGSNFTIVLNNSANANNPLYRYPYLQIFTSDYSPAATHSQFVQGMRTVSSDVATLQSTDNISVSHKIETRILEDSGPVDQRGSAVRSDAALALLGLVAAFLLANFFDRRMSRVRHGKKRQRHAIRNAEGLS
jgi:hypothetical protein